MGRVALQIGLILGSASLLAGNVWAADQVQTFRKEVKQIMGSAQSQDDARAAALAKARRDAVEEAGVWLENQSVVQNFQLEKDQVTTLATGITQTKVVEEGPYLENGAVGYRVVAEVRVNNTGLAERVKQFLADRQRVAEAKATSEREQALLARLGELERRVAALQSATPEQRQAVRASLQENARQLSAQEWYEKGHALWTRTAHGTWEFTDPAQAMVCFSEALKLDPNFALAYVGRGHAYANLKQHQRAIQDYDRAIELDPNFALAYGARALAYANLNQPQRAIQDYDRAIELDPNYALAYLSRGNAYSDLKQYQRAIQDYDRANALDPKDALPYFYRGLAYFNLKQYQRAIQDFDQAIELDPNDAVAYFARGYAHLALGQRALAFQDGRKACQLGVQSACDWLEKNPE